MNNDDLVFFFAATAISFVPLYLLADSCFRARRPSLRYAAPSAFLQYLEQEALVRAIKFLITVSNTEIQSERVDERLGAARQEAGSLEEILHLVAATSAGAPKSDLVNAIGALQRASYPTTPERYRAIMACISSLESRLFALQKCKSGQFSANNPLKIVDEMRTK